MAELPAMKIPPRPIKAILLLNNPVTGCSSSGWGFLLSCVIFRSARMTVSRFLDMLVLVSDYNLPFECRTVRFPNK